LLNRANVMHLVAADKADFSRIGSMINITPTQLPGASVISAAQAKALVDKGVPVYDVRMADLYRDEHVPKSILNEYKEVSAKEIDFDASLDTFDLSKLPSDKTKPFIMYCDGTACWKSYKSTTVAVQKGYKNIYWLRGGLPEWKDARYPVEK